MMRRELEVMCPLKSQSLEESALLAVLQGTPEAARLLLSGISMQHQQELAEACRVLIDFVSTAQ
jgi:hypothetical protein